MKAESVFLAFPFSTKIDSQGQIHSKKANFMGVACTPATGLRKSDVFMFFFTRDGQFSKMDLLWHHEQ